MIPRSQIKQRYTTGGEFLIQKTEKEFVGHYMETSSGTFYAGTSNISLGVRLIPIPNKPDQWEPTNIAGRGMNVRKHKLLKPEIKKFLSTVKPIPTMKKLPSDKDYIKGFVYRYFFKRINSPGYQEIEKEVYDSIKQKGQKYDYHLHEVGQIKWALSGNVFKTNGLNLKRKEKEFPGISFLFPVLNEFAREPLQNQENLYTSGGELYYSDGTEYIGAYHIHTTQGPMVGAYHIDSAHSRLYYTDELPLPPDTSYEDFLQGYPPPTVNNPIIPVATNPQREPVPPPPSPPGESYNCVVSYGPAPFGYQGLITEDGQIPIASSCEDPGDGTGTFRYETYGSYFFNACKVQCEGTSVPNDTGGFGVGCMMPWDPNYCPNPPCTIHDQNMCANNYSGYGGFGGTSGGQSSGGFSGGSGGGLSSGFSFGLGGDCFIGKTPIIMGDETIKRIDEVKIGDIVKSEINTSNVIGIDIHKEKEYTIYSINNSEAFVTAEHPFKTTTGWKAIDPLETFKVHGIESNILEIGDILITKEGTEEVKSIDKSTQTTNIVYNLQLDNEHVYYANGYLVHNNKGGGIWSLDDLEQMQGELGLDSGNVDNYGTAGEEFCPCGMFQGTMIYSPSCC